MTTKQIAIRIGIGVAVVVLGTITIKKLGI